MGLMNMMDGVSVMTFRAKMAIRSPIDVILETNEALVTPGMIARQERIQQHARERDEAMRRNVNAANAMRLHEQAVRTMQQNHSPQRSPFAK